MNPGSIVTCRNRDWVLLPNEDPNLLLLRPLTGATDEVVAVHKGLTDVLGYSFPEERVRSAKFPPPTPDDLSNVSGAHLLWQAARLTLREGATPLRSLGRVSNVETLVNTLTEIEKGQAHPIYPFVTDWKSQLLSLVGPEFRTVSSFREKIVDQVKAWVQPESKNKAKYYEGLKRLKNDLNFPLKVFSLNYDMCVEWLGMDDFRVETGFEQRGEELVWDWRRFDEANPHREDVQIYLYKMHGSINWKRDENDNLLAVDYTGSNIAAMELPIIFGRDFKLEAGDPYLFYAFEFRRSTLESKLILVIGYGFGDGHINKMIRQALRASPTRKVVVVGHCTQEQCPAKAKFIADRLGVDPAKIHVLPASAEAFLCQPGIAKAVIELVPEEEKTVF